MPDLTSVESEIINYLRENAGVSKTDIVRHIRNKQLGSRMTVLEYIKDLEARDMIFGKKERLDSQSYMMYVNEDNELLNMITELEEFKEAYVSLLEKSMKIINTKDYSADAKMLGLSETDPSKWSNDDKIRYSEFGYTKLIELKQKTHDIEKQVIAAPPSSKQDALTILDNLMMEFTENVYVLTFTPIGLFYTVVDLVFFRSMIIWPHLKNIKDLTEIYSVTYKKVTEIQLELSRFLESIIIIKDNIGGAVGLLVRGRYNKSRNIKGDINFYRKLGMGLEIQRIAYQLVKLNKDLENLKLFGLDTMSLTPIPTPTPTPIEREHKHDYIITGETEERIQDMYGKEVEEEPIPAGPTARKAIRENYDHTLDHMFDLGETRTTDQIAYTKIAYPISTDIVSFHGHKIMGKRVITTDSKDMGKVIKISPHLVFIKKKDKENLPNDMNNIHYIQRGFFKYFDKDSLYTLISRKQFEEISERNKQTYREKYEKDSDIEQISSSSSQSKPEDSSKVTSTSSHSS